MRRSYNPRPWKGLQGQARRDMLKSLCPECGNQYDSLYHFLDCNVSDRRVDVERERVIMARFQAQMQADIEERGRLW